MAALREQVQAGHLDRQVARFGRAEFVVALMQSGSDLNEANQAENKERRRSLIATLAAYMKLLAKHEKSRRQEASRLHKARAMFVANLTRATDSQRKANATENTAARSGWLSQAI
tara:strand:+ start:1527 stop:1871 length:345 start_codon:yes stop_codon:yes gene_type:complete